MQKIFWVALLLYIFHTYLLYCTSLLVAHKIAIYIAISHFLWEVIHCSLTVTTTKIRLLILTFELWPLSLASFT